VSGLIDSTEMYLRTLFELEEEQVVPLRARLAERLGQSAPAVSEMVAKLVRQDLVTLTQPDHQVQLTDSGRELATRVMRKHRLAECLLIDLLELPWEDAHEEACRWEHVMSDAAERRVFDVLGRPVQSPYGMPIPGLDALLERPATPPVIDPLAPIGLAQVLREEAGGGALAVRVHRIDEPLQHDPVRLLELRDAGVSPGTTVTVTRTATGVRIGEGKRTAALTMRDTTHVLVTVES
jgi:DtxR family Mn-dependent transcriptional regulator